LETLNVPETNVTESNTVTKAHYVMGVLGGGSKQSGHTYRS